MTTEATTPPRKQLGLLLWLAGMVGACSLLLVLPSLLSNLTMATFPFPFGSSRLQRWRRRAFCRLWQFSSACFLLLKLDCQRPLRKPPSAIGP